VDAFTSAVDWAGRISRKEVSPLEVADLYLERIERLDPQLNAFCHRADEEVRAAAKRAADVVVTTDVDELPPFCGVPLPIKDLNRVAGWPTTYGSRGASDKPNTESDPIVDRFIGAGFVLLGTTNAPELGTISYTESAAHGVTRNPWNTDHTPGGSSGGAGAALAAGLAPIVHGSDGGGSIRIPSSCCGLVGLKPSRNRVPNGINELEGLATSGVLSHSVADTAAAYEVIGMPDALDWYNAPPPPRPWSQLAAEKPPRLRIGVTSTPAVDTPVAPACVEAVERTARVLSELGHQVGEVTLTLPSAEAFVEAFGVIWNTGSAGVPVDPDKLEPLNQALRAAGQATHSIAYVEAVQRTQLLGRHLVGQFGGGFDVLLQPTMACEPPLCGSVWDGADADPMVALLNCFPMGIFTSVWNVTGLPAISIPVYMAPSGLPVGVQLIAGPWQDATVLQLAAQVERALPWADRRPPVS
jgi:amidase